MSEFINNSENRKRLLKHLILQIHQGVAPGQVKGRLVRLLQSIPYDEVVEVEQELISEGLPAEEVLRFCDIHSQVLEGSIDTAGAKEVPAGHPVDTFLKENRELRQFIDQAKDLINEVSEMKDENFKDYVLKLKSVFNNLSDVDKHYKRKEYLLFPPLEKNGITGPPKVMWGKHDEIRELLKSAHEALDFCMMVSEEFGVVVDFILKPTLDGLGGMIMKEEEILLPMALDTLSEEEWYSIYVETPQYGFCLYDPTDEWKPEHVDVSAIEYKPAGGIQLSTGSFENGELEALFESIPVEITIVDRFDKVKFYSHGTTRTFPRTRAVLGRDVRLCHPPGSVHIVEQIVNDFKEGKENKASFWISNFKGRFIYIEYTALRDKDGTYLGVVEFTQDVTDLRKLEGDQRLLSYSNNREDVKKN